MKCGDTLAHAKEAPPELAPEVLPATHKNAIELSTGKVQTRRWACSCGWARYEVDVDARVEMFLAAAEREQLAFRFGTPGCAAGCP